MKLVILLLISISTFILVSSVSLAESEMLSDGVYLLQGSGFIVTEDSIDDSELDFQLLTEDSVGGRMTIVLEDGLISVADDDYIASDGWTGTIMREGRFLRLSGNAENIDGNEINLRLFGRLVEDSQEGSVYALTGRLTKNDESIKIAYTAKIIGISNLQKNTQEETKEEKKIVQINILSGASNQGNINYYSLDTVEITPGVTIIWKNDDSVSHRIMSGVASFSHGKPFKPDGKIDSGDIAPGETFETTINELGIIRFFDTKYSWMDGVIVSLSAEKSTSLKSTETGLDIEKKYQ